MLIDETTTTTLSPEHVRDLMSTEAFQHAKADRLGAIEFGMRVTDGPTRTVVTRRRFETAGFPEFLKPMMRPTIVAVETERWAPDDAATGVLTGDFEVDVEGAPVSLRGQVRIEPHDGGARLTFTGDLRAGVPLFRAKVEQSAASSVLDTIRTEFALLEEHETTSRRNR
ncbi:DUF2505 domain-containing protein [Myceligenerans xiligouense]|uniref:Uncharacterized protein DUF2505 n=1 Tax=Myceligenerans xiligouense TaxID=253184 RepID=A0A3N4Z3K5_9MICO|nr:DUF2505 domain-containing protein [Myceligenerans xiligouense]RPF19722.1 uncharacterized protein DUF2505 [Myceligenerans xiligouense]